MASAPRPVKKPTRAATGAPAKPPRRRRDAAEARQAILDATEKRLVLSGPAGIRLQEVAAEVGVSHPTVLHHFGSREALVEAVVARAFASIHAGLVTAIEASTGGESQLAALMEGVFEALNRGGHARVVLWMALEGQKVDGVDVRLADVITATHALRKKKRGEARPPSREDTAYTVVLAAMALVSSAVMGPILLEDAGMPHDEAAGARFRAWFARLLSAHLESG